MSTWTSSAPLGYRADHSFSYHLLALNRLRIQSSSVEGSSSVCSSSLSRPWRYRSPHLVSCATVSRVTTHGCRSYILSAIGIFQLLHVVDDVREREVLGRRDDAELGHAAEVWAPPTLSEEAHDALVVLRFCETMLVQRTTPVTRRSAAHPGSASPGRVRPRIKPPRPCRSRDAASSPSRRPPLC